MGNCVAGADSAWRQTVREEIGQVDLVQTKLSLKHQGKELGLDLEKGKKITLGIMYGMD